jgi:hypothetical protein
MILYLSALPALRHTVSAASRNFEIMERAMRLRFGIALMILCAFGVGCAFDVTHINFRPSQFMPVPGSSKQCVMKESVEITEGPCAYYSRKLNKGTYWDFIGTIPEGEVYKPRDQVLTIEASHVYEAYLVLSNDSLVGFYLPVERAFAPLPNPKKLPIELKKGG